MVDEPRTQGDPDAPPTEDEVRASSRLRDELAADPAVLALRSAWAPDELSAAEHAELVASVPTGEELRSAADLRDGLETAPPVLALRGAWSPTEIDGTEHRAIVARALGTNVVRLTPRARVVRLATPAAALLAVAAILVLWIGRRPEDAPLARSGSTQPLFEEPFASGHTTARIDKIAIARGADHRDNRFAKWGVR